MNDANGRPKLFISYSNRDAAWAQKINELLRNRGVRTYLDTFDDEIQGNQFLGVIDRNIETACAVAVLIGSSGLSPMQRLEVDKAIILSATKGLRVVPVFLPEAAQSANLELFLECFSWIDLRKGSLDEKIDRLARVCTVSADGPLVVPNHGADFSLCAVLKGVKQRLIIAGHTLGKFTVDEDIKSELISLPRQGKSITLVQLNPESPYAKAHQPFHKLESRSSADNQYKQSLKFFESLFGIVNEEAQQLIDVSFSSYMPRFRTIVVDDTAYIYLYMYGADVAKTPDFILQPSETADDIIRQRIIYSTLNVAHAPDSIPFIRSGQIFPHWKETHIAKWTEWEEEERDHHSLTHTFYNAEAEAFDLRYGDELEPYVIGHLGLTTGSTLVLGCGSGKEVEHLSKGRPQDYILGVDSSHVAIKLARKKRKAGRFMLGDFYDLDLPEFADPMYFQSVVANAAFVHLLKRDDLDAILKKIWQRMPEGGVLFLRCLYKEVERKAVNQEVDKYSPRWFVYYSPIELAERCRKAGFGIDIKATDQIVGSCGFNRQLARQKGVPHRSAPDTYWSCVLARKVAQTQPSS